MMTLPPSPTPGFSIPKMVRACLAMLAMMMIGYAGASPLCKSGKIHEEKFVSIGGIEQWIVIKGEHCANPVILFLHGGPGNALSPYADALYGKWAKDFTLVQWDQRGAGKTFGRNKQLSETALTLEQMAADGIEVANFLRRHLGKQKIILVGGSWGSILGVHMAKLHPERFHAYVGVSQVVGQRENQASSYAAVRALATSAKDDKLLAALDAMGSPPWTDPRNPGVLRRGTRMYEAKATVPAPASWWIPAPGYDTPQALADSEESDDYSYLQFVGLKGDGMYSRIDLNKLGSDFLLPVFIIQGAEDLVTMPDVTRRYFDSMRAPAKEFVLVPQAGHDPNLALVDAQYKVLMERVRPGVQ